MARRGRNPMALEKDCVMHAFSNSGFAIKPLFTLKCEVLLYHSEAYLQPLIILVSII
jgi:hypothetical protein